MVFETPKPKQNVTVRDGRERFGLAETKQFQNSFQTVLKLFCFCFVHFADSFFLENMPM